MNSVVKLRSKMDEDARTRKTTIQASVTVAALIALIAGSLWLRGPSSERWSFLRACATHRPLEQCEADWAKLEERWP